MNNNIHETATVHPEAKIAEDVTIGAYSLINANVIIEAGSNIGPYCEIGVENELCSGSPLTIGQNSIIRSHSIFYASSHFGPGLTTGHRVTVRENTRAGSGLQIGTLSDIQGDCEIGKYTRLHSNVHIGKKSVIKDFVWIFPYVVLTNDPHPPSNLLIGVTIDEYAVLATMSVILPGVTVGKSALVAAHSCVKDDVEPNTVYAGSPARKICTTDKIKMRDGTNRPAYPWTSHFQRGYPKEVVQKWTLAEN